MEWIMWLIIPAGVAAWVYSDAKKRGRSDSAVGWAIGTFLLLIIVLPAWLITRPKAPEEGATIGKPILCIHCGKYCDGNPTFCPNCGHEIAERSNN